MIEVKSVTKSFEGKEVLHNIDAAFHKGKTNLIIGRSGSGKTVLVKCIIGLLSPDSGEILYDGRDFLKMDMSQKRNCAQKSGCCFRDRLCLTMKQCLEMCCSR